VDVLDLREIWRLSIAAMYNGYGVAGPDQLVD
jgi:hypothetical protein